jgi:hypothetical protein
MSSNDGKAEKVSEAESAGDSGSAVQVTQHQSKKKAAANHVPSVSAAARAAADHISPRSVVTPRSHTVSPRKHLDPHVLLQSLFRASLAKQEYEKQSTCLLCERTLHFSKLGLTREILIPIQRKY